MIDVLLRTRHCDFTGHDQRLRDILLCRSTPGDNIHRKGNFLYYYDGVYNIGRFAAQLHLKVLQLVAVGIQKADRQISGVLLFQILGFQHHHSAGNPIYLFHRTADRNIDGINGRRTRLIPLGHAAFKAELDGQCTGVELFHRDSNGLGCFLLYHNAIGVHICGQYNIIA